MADIYYVRQKEALGLGHAIYSARKFIGNEPFAVLLGDDVIYSEVPVLRQMMNHYERYGASIVGVQEVPIEDTSKYGIVDGRNLQIDFIELRIWWRSHNHRKPQKLI